MSGIRIALCVGAIAVERLCQLYLDTHRSNIRQVSNLPINSSNPSEPSWQVTPTQIVLEHPDFDPVRLQQTPNAIGLWKQAQLQTIEQYSQIAEYGILTLFLASALWLGPTP